VGALRDPLTQLADLHVFERSIILWSYAKTTQGMWIALGPVVKLSDSATDEELAAGARAVLDGSRTGTPQPAKLEGLKHVLAVAGVRSERAFNKGARSVGLRQEIDGTLILDPRKPVGGGWVGIDDVALHRPTDAELATAIRRAIADGVPRS
jgi:hypothetical protein